MTRDGIVRLGEKLPACVIAMEACCGAHHLGRVLRDQATIGHVDTGEDGEAWTARPHIGGTSEAYAGFANSGCSGLAQPYPSRPVTVIVRYAPGGNTDVVARFVVLDHVSQTLGQRFVVENVSGAGGTTGSLRAARTNPDGYTLLVGQMGTHGRAVQSAEVTAAEQQAALGGEREEAERLKRDLMASRSRRDRSARNMTSLSILAA